jgi:antitoxin component of RelBE/YafQ-DinJ toxin-antitoxin module
LTAISDTCIREAMKIVINIRMDSKLKSALEKFAEQQGISMSGLIRQVMIRYLQEHGIDWREEGEK